MKPGETQALALVQAAMQTMPKQSATERWLQPALIRQKCNLCSVQFDFSEEGFQVKEKELKREVLLDLAEFAEHSHVRLTMGLHGSDDTTALVNVCVCV